MSDLINKLHASHIEHELNAFKNGTYKKTVEDEVSAIFRWVNDIKLKDVITPEQIIELIKRKVVESPVPGGITELTGEMSRKVLTSKHNEDTLFEDIFERKQFDNIMDKGSTLENVRTYLIKKFLHSSAYSKLISNVLYIAIKEYLITETKIVQKKMPGMSSLLNIGKNTVNIAEKLPVVSSIMNVCKGSINDVLPSLESEIENRIIKYIESTIDNKIQHSENILMEIFNEKHMSALTDQLWDSISKNSLSEYFNTIDPYDMEDFILIGYDFWLHFRKTKYFEKIYKELVTYFFEKYGDNELDVIIDDVGVTEEMVINDVIQLISQAVETALNIGYLEERIRARLESFYLSEKTASLINDNLSE